MAKPSIVVAGRGLHGGAPARVAFGKRAGDTTLNGEPLARWHAIPAERSTAIACGELRARTVEHLFAALAALGLRRGLDVQLEGPEPPILDGCAAAWMDAIAPLAIASVPPAITVAREAVIEVATSRYAFIPGEGTCVSVEIELDDARLVTSASWSGDASDFRRRIATARTFCFEHEVEELARRGLASHVEPQMIVVIGDEILAAGAPFAADEPARHKLLDLVGDLFLYAGPPRGAVDAYRPGHSATHRAMRIAIEEGVLERIG